MHTINILDATRVVELLPADGSSITEGEWRRKARAAMASHGAGVSYSTRVCNWLLECDAVEIRGDVSVARGRALSALLNCAGTIQPKHSPTTGTGPSHARADEPTASDGGRTD